MPGFGYTSQRPDLGADHLSRSCHHNTRSQVLLCLRKLEDDRLLCLKFLIRDRWWFDWEPLGQQVSR